MVEVLTVLAPGLVTGVRRVRDTGKAADVLLCDITQRVLHLWGVAYDKEWPRA